MKKICISRCDSETNIKRFVNQKIGVILVLRSVGNRGGKCIVRM